MSKYDSHWPSQNLNRVLADIQKSKGCKLTRAMHQHLVDRVDEIDEYENTMKGRVNELQGEVDRLEREKAELANDLAHNTNMHRHATNREERAQGRADAFLIALKMANGYEIKPPLRGASSTAGTQRGRS